MTAKLTNRELRRRSLARWIAQGGTPTPETLGSLLSFTESLIRMCRGGHSERFPVADSASWQTLEDLCCHRWAIMVEICETRNDRLANKEDQMKTKPKTRKATVPNDALDAVVALGERLSDLDLADAIDEMTRRCFGLAAAIKGAAFAEVEEQRGLNQLASDICGGMGCLTETFEAERKLREAEERQ